MLHCNTVTKHTSQRGNPLIICAWWMDPDAQIARQIPAAGSSSVNIHISISLNLTDTSDRVHNYPERGRLNDTQ
jgi:hypothetical protein